MSSIQKGLSPHLVAVHAHHLASDPRAVEGRELGVVRLIFLSGNEVQKKEYLMGTRLFDV